MREKKVGDIMSNKDDDIELLDSSINNNQNRSEDVSSSELLGNHVILSLDSSHQSVNTNDYFTSNTSPNPSFSQDKIQTNFNSLDSNKDTPPLVDSKEQLSPMSDTPRSFSNLETQYHSTSGMSSTSDNRSHVSIQNNTSVTTNLNDSTASNNSSLSSMSTTVSSSQDKSADSNNGNDTFKPTKPIVFLIIFLVLLLVIFFLPYIGDFFNKLIPESKRSTEVPKIEDGSLTCTLEHEEENVSYYYTDTYDFKNRKVENLQHVVSIQGGTDFLNQRNAECQNLRQASSNISGISIECNLSSGEMVETQFFNFSTLRDKDVSTGFFEAGGIYPNVEYGDDISEVEKNLTISGYECRES